MESTHAGIRTWSLPSFAAGAVLLSVAWDIAYSGVANVFPPVMGYLPVPVAMLVIPAILCFGLGRWTGEWGSANSPLARVGALAWCIVAPNLAFPILLFLAFVLSALLGRAGAP